jgi:hypothetical protein
MSLPDGPFDVDLDVWNQQIMKLGFGDTSPAGLNERRLFFEGGYFYLKIWDGAAWQDIGEKATQVLAKLLTVDGSGSGLNADLLDGWHKSSFQNASNLTTGSVLRARLNLFTKNNDNGETASPYIQYGSIDTSLATVSFTDAFTSTPHVFVTVAESTSQITVMAYNVTTTSFKIRCLGDDGVGKQRQQNWVAIGKKN